MQLILAVAPHRPAYHEHTCHCILQVEALNTILVSMELSTMSSACDQLAAGADFSHACVMMRLRICSVRVAVSISVAVCMRDD